MSIRAGTSADYPDIARVSLLAMPENFLTIAQLNSHEQTRDPRCKLGYFVADVADQIVGFARYIQWADMYHPQIFWITVQVDPEHQGKGIGTQLYQAVSDELAQFKPIAFKSSIYESNQGAKAFSQKQGFVEYSRRIESQCDLPTFDITPYQAKIDALQNEGVRFLRIGDYLEDNAMLVNVYDLQWTLELDVPIEETLTQPSFNHWRKETVDNPMFVGAASFMAVQDDEYMGLTEVFKYDEDNLYIEFTGTRIKYRRRGLATAMKALGMEWGRKDGFLQMRTTNDAVNTAMITLNEKLGFVAQSARIQIEKTFDDTM